MTAPADGPAGRPPAPRSPSAPGVAASRTERFDAFQRKHRFAGFPIAVLYKFFEDQGSYLAALITYYGFVSLFPLLLLFVTILGFALHDNPALQDDIKNSAFDTFPVIGDQLQSDVHQISGSALALIFGVLGALYGGLGVAQAAQNAMNKVWAVPRNRRPNPLLARGRSALLLLLLGSGLVVATAVSTLGKYLLGKAGVHLTGSLTIVSPVVSVVVNMILFLAAFRLLTVKKVRYRDLLPGVVLAALGFKGLQTLGSDYLRHVARSDATYGAFALVLGLIAWIYLVSLVLVFCSEINAVRVERLWPRALLTPFTDDVELTDADRRAYTSYSKTERYKDYQRIDVEFPAVTPPPRTDPPPPDG